MFGSEHGRVTGNTQRPIASNNPVPRNVILLGTVRHRTSHGSRPHTYPIPDFSVTKNAARRNGSNQRIDRLKSVHFQRADF